jgi:Na+:H+ antiporter, NhaA family
MPPFTLDRPRRVFESAFDSVITPFGRFLARTTAGGIVLMATTAVALLAGALLGDHALDVFWDQYLSIALGERRPVGLSLHHWINDGLMAIFFLRVGLELKREMLTGELASLRDAALPVAGAIGGMLVPAAIFLALNAGTPHARGWGIPMATDIAFAIGILVLLGKRVPRNLVVFLTALAIADDLGAVIVVAVFYTAQLEFGPLAGAVGFGALLTILNLGGVRRPLPYALVGLALWITLYRSGLHPTLAGIGVAMAVPARGGDDSPLERWEHGLGPWVTFIIVPVFALANAGIDLTAIAWREALASSLTLGVVGGLAIGKFVGITLFSALAVWTGLARLPEGVGWRHLLGAAWLGGIGFTMSLFIGELAFPDPGDVEQAKLGILLASALSAVAGLAWLVLAARGGREPAR